MRKLRLVMVLISGLAAFFYTTANADLEPTASFSAFTSQQGPPAIVQPNWSSEPPVLTQEQKESREYWLDHTNLSGPIFSGTPTEVAGPESGTESTVEGSTGNPATGSLRESRPVTVGNSDIFVDLVISKLIPSDYQSNPTESNLGVGGKDSFFTGNGFVARSTTGGDDIADRQYANPHVDFPGFCGEQRALYDASRDTFFWLRQGAPDANGENEFKLGVSKDGCQTFAAYTVKPTNIQ